MIIGFAGKAASGKTTAAGFIRERKDNAVILPMAQMLREEVESFLALVGADEGKNLVYGDQEDKIRIFHVATDKALELCPCWNDFVDRNQELQDRPGATAVTIRRILQWWGTEYRRAQDPDYWTKAWERKLRDFDLEKTHLLVDDVRFVNELEVIRNNGGRFVRIVRPGFNGANNHSSENSLDHFNDWDLVINNSGGLEHFRRQVIGQLLPLLDSDSRS